MVKYKEILPENTPEKKVLAGEIGITNQAAKRMGTIGVRLIDDDLFSPTGEILFHKHYRQNCRA